MSVSPAVLEDTDFTRPLSLAPLALHAPGTLHIPTVTWINWVQPGPTRSTGPAGSGPPVHLHLSNLVWQFFFARGEPSVLSWWVGVALGTAWAPTTVEVKRSPSAQHPGLWDVGPGSLERRKAESGE